MIRDSRDYEGSVLAPARNEAQAYYYGYKPSLNPDGSPYSDTQIIQDRDATYEQVLGYDQESANKSTYVSSDVRDAVMLSLPSLVRCFASSNKPVYLVPRTEAEVQIAEQQENYVNYVFWNDNPGFLTLYGAFKDAMTVRTGYVKWWTDNHPEKKYKAYVNISQIQIQMLMSQEPGSRITHLGTLDPQTQTYDEVEFQYVVNKPIIRVMGVPPEEMRLDRYARTFATSRIVGHERVVPVDELTAMGYPREQCLEYLQSQDIHQFTMESQMRNPGRYMSTRIGDGVNYGEWYIKIDRDGDGIAELRYVCTMGEDHTIVYDVPANRVKFAIFGCDPISHTIVGDSLADYVKDIQRYKTNMMRGVLDSLAESINPKTVVNELVTDLDDALNDDLGAVVRVRGDPRSAVAFATTPFAGQAALPILELLNDVLQRRTGLSDAAKGLDPKALQSSTQVGVEAIINGQQERIELIARVFAETGFRDLFHGLYNEIAENPNQRRTIQVNGNWTEVNTSQFDASMGVEVNANLGKGSDAIRLMTLQNIKQTQEQIMQMYGPTNPVVGIPQYLNTITDMLEISNIKNVGRYFMTPTPQVLQAIASQPKEPDAMTIAARAQFEKVKSQTATEVGDQALRQQKQDQDNAFREAQLRQKTLYDQQKLEIERAKVRAQIGADDRGQVDPIEAVKIGADMHQAHLDAGVDLHKAHLAAQTAERQMQADYAADMARIQQQREVAHIQAATAAGTAAQGSQDNSGGGQ